MSKKRIETVLEGSHAGESASPVPKKASSVTREALERHDDGEGHARLLSEDEAIDMLNLGDRPNPKAALRWLMRKGRLRYVELGRGVYSYRECDIEAAINNGLSPAIS
jgi:hypothetical protein